MAKRHELVVHLCADAMAAEKGMDLEGKVEGSASGRHGFDFALGGEDEYFGSEEVELDCVEEIHGVGLRVVENFFYGVQPFV